MKVHLKFNNQIDKLLDERKKYQNNVDQGVLPSFDPLTEEIRKSDWTVRDIPENLVIPPDRWLDAQTDQEARRQVIEQLDFLLYGSITGARHVLAGGELRFVFLGFQLLWIVALGLASQHLWRFRQVSILAMAALPLVYLAPHLFYQVDVYYPRHVVIGYLAMAAVAFYAVTAPSLKNSDT